MLLPIAGATQGKCQINVNVVERLEGLRMKYRCLSAFRVLACVVAAGSLAPVGVAGQSGTTRASPKKAATTKPWTAPLTPDGQLDLQGIWLNNSATPLERPKALEGRTTLTDEEVTELRKRATRLFGAKGDNDFANGDNPYLAVLANVERFRNLNATGGSDEMIERVFDNRTSLIVDPPDGRLPLLTQAGRDRQATAASGTFAVPWQPGIELAEQQRQAAVAAAQRKLSGPEDLPNGVRCITWGVPQLTGGPYNGYAQILQTSGYVIFLGEANHELRIIPLDNRPHLPSSVRQWNGDSRGHWEGQTLVVDTGNFAPGSYFMGSAENLHMIERFTRVSADMINYQITFDDSTTWTMPWTAVVRLKRSANKIYESACHEGNEYVMHGILSGARVEEKAAEEAAKGLK
jgi:hypothetical protein